MVYVFAWGARARRGLDRARDVRAAYRDLPRAPMRRSLRSRCQRARLRSRVAQRGSVRGARRTSRDHGQPRPADRRRITSPSRLDFSDREEPPAVTGQTLSRDLLRHLPKAELHCHLDGSVRPQTPAISTVCRPVAVSHSLMVSDASASTGSSREYFASRISNCVVCTPTAMAPAPAA